MTIIPNQPFGLGDIIFTQTLVRHIADGRRIVWPVFPQFVEGLNRAYPDITFVDWRTIAIDYERKDQYETILQLSGEEVTVLPLRWADVLLNLPYDCVMKAKYMLYGLDWERWRECAMWNITDRLNKNLSITHFYFTLVNRHFGSDNKLTVPIPTFDNEVQLKPITGHSLFDWTYNIQNASEIHTVNTSIIYLLEMLDLKAKEVHLYQRSIPGQTFGNIDYILQKHKYVFHA